MNYKCKEDIINNLRSAGCSQKEIDCFLSEFCDGDKKLCAIRLRQHRTKLLDNLHKAQQRIDCLDYFLYKLDKDEINID